MRRPADNLDMKRSSDRIRTTHAGRLPVPPGCENLPIRLFLGEAVDPKVIEEGVAQVVRRQLDLGIDCIGDGEFWKARDFIYYSRHLTGLESRPLRAGETGSTRTNTRERDEFAQFYKDSDKAGTIFYVPGEKPMPPERERTVATGPIKSKGIGALAQEIDGVQGRARPGRAAGRRDVLLRDRAGLARSFHLQRVLQDRGGVHLRARRGAARGISARSSTPASSCRSTTLAWSTGGTC